MGALLCPGRELHHPAEDGQHAREAPARLQSPHDRLYPYRGGRPQQRRWHPAFRQERDERGIGLVALAARDKVPDRRDGRMSSRSMTTASALIGTGTIDLYKTNRLAMRKWGVRQVDIDVLEWGSTKRVSRCLRPAEERPAGPRT